MDHERTSQDMITTGRTYSRGDWGNCRSSIGVGKKDIDRHPDSVDRLNDCRNSFQV
jgi:hypothetical protein